jgi:hypothetical protein
MSLDGCRAAPASVGLALQSPVAKKDALLGMVHLAANNLAKDALNRGFCYTLPARGLTLGHLAPAIFRVRLALKSYPARRGQPVTDITVPRDNGFGRQHLFWREGVYYT